MAIINENELTKKIIQEIAEIMVIAARTAPKGRGLNFLDVKIATDQDIERISLKMKDIGEKKQRSSFIRDAENILSAEAIVLIASKIQHIDLNCGMCGFETCAEKNIKTPCVFNTVDLGIAIGSAASTASSFKADNRIMYTVGQAVLDLNIFSKDYIIIFGIPLASLSKNPFYDRK
ncbi:MAG: DUF2148 domain-containing protein [Bacteroidota bacterium]